MKTHRSWWSEPGLVAWRSQECWARPGSPPGDRAGQRLGDGRDRHSPASERRPRPAGTGPGTSGGRPGPSRSPASGCWTTAGASWPRSTWVSCGAPSAPASPCPAPTCTKSCVTVCRCAGPRHPVLGAAGWAGAGHLQRRRRWRVRPGRRRRRAALHGPAAGRGPSTTGPGRPAQLAVPGRRLNAMR
jgi:hypothetical protein